MDRFWFAHCGGRESPYLVGSSVGPPGLEPGTYGLKDHAPRATMASEGHDSRDSGPTIGRQPLPRTPFRVTFDVTRRLARDERRAWPARSHEAVRLGNEAVHPHD